MEDNKPDHVDIDRTFEYYSHSPVGNSTFSSDVVIYQ